MKNAILIFLGGGLGSIARFYVARFANTIHNFPIPFGTLLVNILASIILGLLIGSTFLQKNDNNIKLFVSVGFCGGFSTFSTFSAENLVLLESGKLGPAFLNIFLNVVLCILATFAGVIIGKLIVN